MEIITDTTEYTKKIEEMMVAMEKLEYSETPNEIGEMAFNFLKQVNFVLLGIRQVLKNLEDYTTKDLALTNVEVEEMHMNFTDLAIHYDEKLSQMFNNRTRYEYPDYIEVLFKQLAYAEPNFLHKILN